MKFSSEIKLLILLNLFLVTTLFVLFVCPPFSILSVATICFGVISVPMIVLYDFFLLINCLTNGKFKTFLDDIFD